MTLDATFLKYYIAPILWFSLSLNGANWYEADPCMDKFSHQLTPGRYYYGTPWIDDSFKYTSPKQPAYGTIGIDVHGMSTFAPNPEYDSPLMDDNRSCPSIRAVEIDGYTSYPFVAAPLTPDPTFNGHYRFLYAQDTPMAASVLPRASAAILTASPSSLAEKPKKPRHHFSVGKTLSRAFHSVRQLFTKRIHNKKKHPTDHAK